MILRLFDIQTFSVHDGPGIRTSVFMKGCPLRCQWCHNPESASGDRQILYYGEKCSGCGNCVKVCASGANYLNAGVHHYVKEKCVSCGLCAETCPAKAFEMAGYDIKPAELLRKIARDRAFYQETGGGVTFTGGEPFAQILGLKTMTGMCRKENIHVAVETSMMTAWDNVELVYGDVDLWICDIKAFSGELHEKGTGSGNSVILDNIGRLLTLSPEKVWIRIPFIIGFNDKEEEIIKLAEFLNKHEAARVEVMPYHNLGLSKYYALYQKQNAHAFAVPNGMIVDRCRELLRQHNVHNVL